MLAHVTGCTSIKMKDVEPDGSGTTIIVKARPKDFKDVSFQWGDMKFKAGMAVTTDDPWAEIGKSIAEKTVPAAMCAYNPIFCAMQATETQEE